MYVAVDKYIEAALKKKNITSTIPINTAKIGTYEIRMNKTFFRLLKIEDTVFKILIDAHLLKLTLLHIVLHFIIFFPSLYKKQNLINKEFISL